MGDPQLRDYRVVGGLEVFADRSFWPNFFSRTVARLQWDPAAIDLSGDIRAWRGLRAERRRRLTTLLAGFCVAEDAVAEELTPFSGAARQATLASKQNLVAWVFFLQRRDEQRHGVETQPSPELLGDLLVQAEEAAEAWGDAVPAATRAESAQKVVHRLRVAGLLKTPVAA
jgi:hypothetical protein